jgi:RNA polymerase sigma factor (sigma-70 family)
VDHDIERLVIESAQAGSPHAWRQLFAWHFDAVYRFARTLAPGGPDRAEEITQQVFVTAAGRIRQFRSSQATFRSWLLGIARKHHLSLAAKEARRRRHEKSAVEACRTSREDGEDLHVHEALARLPHEYHRVLEAKYLHRHTQSEIAEAQGQSIEAVESLLRRARERFARIYEQLKE